MLRVLHVLDNPYDDPRDPLLIEIAGLRDEPGCVSAEIYKTLAEGEEVYALTSIWESEEAYATFWTTAMTGDGYETLTHMVTRDETVTEFYQRVEYALTDGVWQVAGRDKSHQRVFWPASGEVRIIIQNAVNASDEMYAKIRGEIAETRREEGCLEYAWCENVELPGHLLLLETWANQVIYDRHWQMRGDTAEFCGDNLRRPAEPQRGPVSREFYRRQVFRHHYDRWMPADPMAYSQTIIYPAS